MEKLVERVKAILLTPQTEWPVIAREPEDTAGLLTRYVAILALIPALAGLIGGSLIGGYTPILSGLIGAIVGYVLTFVTVFVVALIVDALTPTFGAQKGFPNALKLTVYSYTPFWLAGFFLLAPGLRFLVVLSLYGAYLLWKGLPQLMGTPRTKVAGFAAVIVGCAGALTLILTAVEHAMFGLSVL